MLSQPIIPAHPVSPSASHRLGAGEVWRLGRHLVQIGNRMPPSVGSDPDTDYAREKRVMIITPSHLSNLPSCHPASRVIVVPYKDDIPGAFDPDAAKALRVAHLPFQWPLAAHVVGKPQSGGIGQDETCLGFVFSKEMPKARASDFHAIRHVPGDGDVPGHPPIAFYEWMIKLFRTPRSKALVYCPGEQFGHVLLAAERQSAACHTALPDGEAAAALFARWEAVTGGKAERMEMPAPPVNPTRKKK